MLSFQRLTSGVALHWWRYGADLVALWETTALICWRCSAELVALRALNWWRLYIEQKESRKFGQKDLTEIFSQNNRKGLRPAVILIRHGSFHLQQALRVALGRQSHRLLRKAVPV